MASRTVRRSAVKGHHFSGTTEELLREVDRAERQLAEADVGLVEATELRAEAHEQTEKLRMALRALGVEVEEADAEP